MAASAAPPRTVKSSPCRTARRPSIRPWPITTFAGRKSVSSPSASYVPWPASMPVSWKVSGSKRRSTRSRTVRRPVARWRSTRSAPPICRASSSRRRSSAISGSQPGSSCGGSSMRAERYPLGRRVLRREILVARPDPALAVASGLEGDERSQQCRDDRDGYQSEYVRRHREQGEEQHGEAEALAVDRVNVPEAKADEAQHVDRHA